MSEISSKDNNFNDSISSDLFIIIYNILLIILITQMI